MPTGPLRQPALWEVVTEQLRAAILSGELAPGSKIVETEFAERFGTSRGPIREAIRELAREGLVVELPRRGTVVSTLSAHDLAEVYGVREALDLAAAKRAIAAAADAELQALEQHLEALESETAYLAAAVHDLAFHRAIVDLARNERMSAIYDQMLTQTMLLLRATAEVNVELRTALRPAAHREIFDALVARDPDRVQAAIDDHYRYAEERLFDGSAFPEAS
jgi:DNA-binding GntR family transcriptional regulator